MRNAAFFLLIVFVGCSAGKEISFEEKGQLYLNVKINDSVSGNFMFDTGAGAMSFDSAFYYSNIHKHSADIRKSLLAGAGNSIQNIEYLSDSFTVRCGNYSRTMSYPLIFNHKVIFGEHCDGTIGWEYFKNRIIQIDYDAGNVLVYDDLPDVSGFSKIPFLLVDNKIILKAILSLNDKLKIKGDFFLDTGFNGALALTSSTVSKYSLNYLDNKEMFYREHGGIGGSMRGFNVQARCLEFEEFRINKFKVNCLQNESGGMAQPSFEGNIGNKILKRFTILLDFKSSMLYLKPSKLYNSPIS